MLLGLKLKVVFAGVIGLLLLGMLGTAYWQYARTVAENKVLVASNALLNSAVKTQDHTILTQREALADWEQHSKAQAVLMETLQDLGQLAQAETRRLNDLFRQHDLGALASARPGLIERRLNAGTDRARCLLEQASGADRPKC